MMENEKYIDRRTALRYMGISGDVPDGIFELLDECERELSLVMTPRCTWTVKKISDVKDLLCGDDIKRHLSGCASVALFAATLGSGVDSLIRKYQSTDVTRAMITDAEASAAIEVFCDSEEEKIASKTGKFLTFRYSPGYGDLPLEVQSSLLEVSDAGRKIGLCLSESCMLSPSKSVTAFIGLSENKTKDAVSSCAVCSMRENCLYKKKGVHCGDK